MTTRTLLTVLPAEDPEHRIAVMLVQDDEVTGLELQHQSWGEGVGWFTQSTVPLEAEQTAQLRQLLRVSAGTRCPSVTSNREAPQLRICSAESA